jgi:hypothetical protein
MIIEGSIPLKAAHFDLYTVDDVRALCHDKLHVSGMLEAHDPDSCRNSSVFGDERVLHAPEATEMTT